MVVHQILTLILTSVYETQQQCTGDSHEHVRFFIQLHDNQLVLLPSRIGELKELRRLAVGYLLFCYLLYRFMTCCVCSHNQLVELPGEMSSLVNLVLLHLEHNKLTRLGEYLQQLEQLEELVGDPLYCILDVRISWCYLLQNVSYNQLADISTSLGCITRLRRLNMSHNRLVEIPSTLCQLKSDRIQTANSNALLTDPL